MALSNVEVARVTWLLRRELCCLALDARTSSIARDIVYDACPGEIKLFAAVLAEHLVGLCRGRGSRWYAESNWFIRESQNARWFCDALGLSFRSFLRMADSIEAFFSEKPESFRFVGLAPRAIEAVQ